MNGSVAKYVAKICDYFRVAYDVEICLIYARKMRCSCELELGSEVGQKYRDR